MTSRKADPKAPLWERIETPPTPGRFNFSSGKKTISSPLLG
jgi:hypothetical protein